MIDLFGAIFWEWKRFWAWFCLTLGGIIADKWGHWNHHRLQPKYQR